LGYYIVAVQSLGVGLKAANKPVTQYIVGNRLNVFRGDKVALG
jgi:hypothetical protein